LNRGSGTTIVTPNTCVAIPATANCVAWDETNNICKKCNTGYILYSNTTGTAWHLCVPLWAYTTNNCEARNTVFWNDAGTNE
jgi:hypothetical protein